MSVLNHAVHHQHATSNTVYHALHGYYYGGRTTQELSAIYSKSDRTIRGWICRFEKEKEYRRHSKSHKSPFGEEERQWVKRFYDTMPLPFLDEAKAAFEEQFKRTISVSTIWRILREIGYTYKVLERRAMNIKMKDRSLLHFVAEVVDNFRTFNMQSIFEHCGWTKNGCFDPRESLGNDKVKLPDDQQQDVYDLLNFVERDDYE
ncbi:hypothetical protein Ae201684P_021283 [Aphanomyces euteiches]|nr:hypothetical protein Ae201684P_021283 [Aphanomyces euteiches]